MAELLTEQFCPRVFAAGLADEEPPPPGAARGGASSKSAERAKHPKRQAQGRYGQDEPVPELRAPGLHAGKQALLTKQGSSVRAPWSSPEAGCRCCRCWRRCHVGSPAGSAADADSAARSWRRASQGTAQARRSANSRAPARDVQSSMLHDTPAPKTTEAGRCGGMAMRPAAPPPPWASW
eukprot:CAMPEP_0179054324 /NCGR_PEP_ID=MMETSP0796-20121207/22726_1 /TAXON_ID=73915 /ORGANISM="Pyrodinium bahamense, Strain pbaha01" /LENGTH=179 /DNA_ID=CAMNT_0020750941 /DNA_START=78 /DNA_END=613 /DNA_ORIENTATION=-